MQDITNMLGGSRSCPEVPKAGSLRGPGPAALGHRRSRRYNPCPSLPTSTAPRRERVTWREVPCIGAPSRFLTHTHTLAHTLAALARARGIRTSQPKTRARTPRPTEFSISSSSKLLGRSPPPLSARIPAPPELRCPPSLKARPVRPLSDAGISHQGLPSVFPGPSGVLGVSPGGSAEVSESGRDASPGNFTNLPGVTGQWRQRRGFPVISVLATRYHRKRAGGSAAQLGAAAVGGSASIPCPSSPALARPSTRTYTPGLPATAPPAAAALTSSSFLLLARDTFCICKASRDRPRTLLPGGRCGVAPAFSGTCAGTRVVGAFAFRLRPGACPLYFAWGWGVPTTF
nr:uncharacterized protein LOC108403657 [Manis javanica]